MEKNKIYSMEDFKRDFDFAKKQLLHLGYDEVETNIYELQFNSARKNVLGRCTHKKMANGGEKYIIALNKLYSEVAPFEDIKNTIMHELAHSTKNGHGHKTGWKAVINRVNSMYGYNIERTTFSEIYQKSIDFKYTVICTDCNKIIAKRQKKTKIIKSIQNKENKYKCAVCGSFNLISEEK